MALKILLLRLLQDYLSSPNAFIGDMVFQAVKTRFPLKIVAGMTFLGLLQESLFILLIFSSLKNAYADNGDLVRQTYLEAHCAYETEDYQQAVRKFSSLQNSYPQMGDYVQHYLALSQAALGDYAQAQQSWQRLLDLYPDSRLKQAARISCADVYLRQEFYLSAARLYRQLLNDGLKNKADLGKVYFNLGLALEALNQTEQAAALYQHVWYSYPTLASLAQIKERMDFLEAKHRWGLPQKSEALYWGKIQALQAEGDCLAALQIIEDYLKEFPESKLLPKLFYTRGEIYLDLNQRQNALDEFKKVYRNYPQSDWATTALFQTGKICWNLGHDPEAVRYLALLVRKYPHSKWLDNALYILGRIHESNEAYNRALNTYQRLAKSYPRSTWADQAYWRMGWIHYRLEQYPLAVNTFERALKKPVKSPWKEASLYWKGRAWENLKETEKATATYNKIISTVNYTYYAQLAQKRISRLSQKNTFTPPPDPVENLPWKYPAQIKGNDDANFHLIRSLELSQLALTEDLKAELDELNKSSQPDLDFWLYLSRAYQSLGAYPQAVRAILIYQNLNHCQRHELDANLRALLYPRFYWDKLVRQAERYNLDPYLLAALIKQESAFNRQARSRSGALGLMQLMPKTAAHIAEQLSQKKPDEEQLFNPAINIQYGSYYFLQLLKRYEGELHLALAAYNAGEDATRKWQTKNKDRDWEEFMEDISYTETRGYVRQVISNYNNYLLLYKEPNNAVEYID
ncbi:MAG: tetratricopeptide repeat protein [Candidatus Schekmanbacteria bacterium]|nr:tetratricopeptide repeat protein [Candidatus Schekmanbacteria bacterium]